MQRSQNQCELCASTEGLKPMAVEPSDGTLDKTVLLCQSCHQQLDSGKLDVNHWRCLNDSMWNQEPAVQVMAYRQLHALVAQGETWAQDALDMLYLDPEVEKWAKLGLPDEDAEPTLDANGASLQAGDSVTLVKDLVVKGANFTAKQGTMVKNISLSRDNHKHIEGKVNGSQIVLVAAYCKRV